jgi:hypothetical protein
MERQSPQLLKGFLKSKIRYPRMFNSPSHEFPFQSGPLSLTVHCHLVNLFGKETIARREMLF